MSRVTRYWLLIFAVSCAAAAASAQSPGDVAATRRWIADRPSWLEPFESFRIADNFYFVGTRGLGEFLFVTAAGDILLDSGLKESVPLVRTNIEKLGFKLTDIKILLSSHAHFDHVAGLADMQRATGAQVFALGEDAAAISSGTDNSGATGLPGWEPVKVARVLKNGDTVRLGGITLTAHLTPGHTKGCTTWTTTLHDHGVPHSAVFVCSLSSGYKLVGNTRYPSIADDYARSIKTLRSLHPEFFFGPHNEFYQMEEKSWKIKTAGTANPFIDASGYQAYIDRAEQTYLKKLESERASAQIRQP